MDNTLQQLKETIAKELGYKDWQGLKDYFGYHVPESILDIVVKRACDIQKTVCTESALLESYYWGSVKLIGRSKEIEHDMHGGTDTEILSINRQSILNAKNIAE